MRGARLLHLLMILQNRGRQTAPALAQMLEVSTRTIHRDIDALTEAGLPVVVNRGSGGGIELGFDYRSAMTALTGDEAEALALMLANPHPSLKGLGLAQAARRAGSKIVERQSTPVRAAMALSRQRFALYSPGPPDPDDPRVPALAHCVRENRVAVLRARDDAMTTHPQGLRFDGDWCLICALTGEIPRRDWGDILVSAKVFDQ